MEFSVALPIRRDVAGISNRKDVNIGRIAEILDDFKSSRLLSFDAVGVDRIYNGHAFHSTELPHDAEGIIEISPYRNNLSSVNKSLHQLANGDFSGGQDHRTLDPSASRIGGCGSRSIAGRSTDNCFCPFFHRLRNRDCHATVFERPRGIEAFVFEINLGPGFFTETRGMNERCRSLTQ